MEKSDLKAESRAPKAHSPQLKAIPIFYPETPADWRKWLHEHHNKEQSVWMVMHGKNSGKKSVTWSNAVDQALCYGWIDSKKIKIDKDTSHQFFSRRKPGGTWSKINKDKVERLISEGLMQPGGLKAIEIAKQNGAWNLLDSVENLEVPADLQLALENHPPADEFFEKFSKSVKKMMLHRVLMAKLPETRQNRIREIAELAAVGKKPKGI